MMGVPFQAFAGANQLSMNMNGSIGGGMMGGDNCVRCGFSGCDVRMTGCGCTMHTCSRPTTGITLVPMSFREMDEARKTAAALASHGGGKHAKKRKSSEVDKGEKGGGEDGDQRTGRWTPAETAYVDELIAKFETGCLPLVDGIKLNDFLAGMLQCKQSRLTKKMKNAKLSSKCFKSSRGYIVDANDAREFSGLEEAFFHSIHCHEERAEIKFHMQKQWRELFSSYCVSVGQPLDADAWLNSVEEIERRASIAKDAARMVRRKLMMGKAYNQDCRNPDRGVIIDRSDAFFNLPADGMKGSSLVSSSTTGPIGGAVGVGSSTDNDEFLSLITDKAIMNEINPGGFGTYNNLGPGNSGKNMSPYLEKVITYLQRSSIPFEHVDAWVPSFVPTTGAEGPAAGNPKCRLCFAGCVTAEIQPPKGSRIAPMSTDEHFNLMSFGEYSQKFSFDIGCGLPGRVYQSGIPTWEQSVHNAPLEHFERCGGAVQCGIKTVVGIPVPSPNVGRIVVVLYSCHDREKDQELVGRLCEEFTRLLPTPRWKLIVDLGRPSESSQRKENGQNSAQAAQAGSGPESKDNRVEEVITLLGEHMPSDSSSPLASYLPGFMTLRLLMLRTSRTEQENELVRTMLDSYASYAAAGRSASDIAVLLARDCMFLSQQSSSQTQTLPPPQLSNTASATLPSTSTTQLVASVGQNMNTGGFIHQPAPSQHTGSIAAAPGWHSSGFMQHMPFHSQGNSDSQQPSTHPPTLSVDHLSQNKGGNEQSANQSQLRLASQSSTTGVDHRNVSE